MVDLLAKFGVDACKTSLEFISPPPVITFFLSGFIENFQKSLLNRMDLNKKSGIIQLFTTKIEENANWTIKTLLLTSQKLIWQDRWHVIDSFEIFDYNILTFWSKFKIVSLCATLRHGRQSIVATNNGAIFFSWSLSHLVNTLCMYSVQCSEATSFSTTFPGMMNIYRGMKQYVNVRQVW